ncbi:MAG: UDP-3-O-(3-hydroxymyristoyl)glucosamine N-acyltransferase [Flavobacteriales bacterium]|nr:UDP-3-O-(3-hydroxymyristoyl)glucosamine N-acyltransferase [Flavobacteriales bacterium]MCB9446905.1 UDP-3-O-(3-hydroxymyristoyl)glucosamine N-acyltransferase [Flavobacteriales bacterium]
MKFTAQEIAQVLNGTVDGNPEETVSSFSKIEEGQPGSLSFLANPKYTHFIYSTRASVVLVNKDFQPEQSIQATLVRVDNAYQSLAKLLEMYAASKGRKSGIHPTAAIAESASVGNNVYIGAHACIGENCRIGDNVQLYPGVILGDHVSVGNDTVLYAGVKVYDDCIIGNACTLHGGVVIGADGFGFAPNTENQYNKVAQIGNVVIEDHVEIGANTTIDRATMGSTLIRKGVKLDNLIQIAHNVEIGENTVIAAQTGIAGSTRIGSTCMIGGQVGIVGHISIANGVKIAAQSGVGQDITEEGTVVQGSPAFAIGDYKKSYVLFRKLPSIKRELEALENELKNKE